jgi:CubicO group peptidase (beta-lactamase class C family)
MSRFWMQVWAVCLLLPVQALPTWAETRLERRIDAYVAPIVAARSFSGVVLVARGDHLLAKRAYGLASQELAAPNRLDSKFQLASASKPITAAAVLKLVEQGKIDLEAPISAILPDYPNGEHITVHQLLTHTSGVPNVNQLPVYRELGLKRRTPAEIVAAFKDAKPDFPPGTSLAYSNSNYVLLALIIEKVSGMPYGEFVQREIFGPLSMTASGHRGDDTAIIDRMSQGYLVQGRSGLSRPAWFDWTVKTGNGSLYATAGDLFRFVRGYFGGRVIGPELLKKATSPAPNLPARAAGFEWMSRQVGYGWMIDTHLGRRRIFHPGNSPGFNTAIAYYPDDQLTVIVLSNIYINNAVLLSQAVAAMTFGQTLTPPVLADDPMTPAEIARLVGDYRLGDDFPDRRKKITVVEENGRLWLRQEGQRAPPSPLLPAGHLAYVDRYNWTNIGFEAPPGAKAAALIYSDGLSSYRAERVP